MSLNYFLIIIFASLCYFGLCYKIPQVKLDLITMGFTLKLTNEPGLKQVVYAININDECPTIMDILFEPQSEWITTQQSKILQPKDKLNISILVNYMGVAYNSNQYLVVGENNMGTMVPNPTASKHRTECGEAVVDAKCKESQTIVFGVKNICEGQLVFEENFNSNELDINKWSYDIRHRLIGTLNEEFVVFDNRRENIFIKDGNLNIKPTFTQQQMKTAKLDFGSRCTPVFRRNTECVLMPQSPYMYVPPVNSSQIHTSTTFQFKYGRIEIKAKLPKGDWILPYIMLRNVGTFEEKQVRIAFARGNDELVTSDNVDISGKILSAGIVTDIENHKTNFKHKTMSTHYGNDFHIYALVWKPNEIVMEVDGVQYGAITENLDELDKLFFISIGVSVGGHVEFPDSLLKPNDKPWLNTSPDALRVFWRNIKNGSILWNGNEVLQIDYVKVYAV